MEWKKKKKHQAYDRNDINTYHYYLCIQMLKVEIRLASLICNGIVA